MAGWDVPPSMGGTSYPHAQDGARMYRTMYRSRYEQWVEGGGRKRKAWVESGSTTQSRLCWDGQLPGRSLDMLGHAGTRWDKLGAGRAGRAGGT